MAAAARYLKDSKDTVRRAIRRGELDAVRPNKQGDSWRIYPAALDRWLHEYGDRVEKHRLRSATQEDGTITRSASPSATSSAIHGKSSTETELERRLEVLEERQARTRDILLQVVELLQEQQSRIDDIRANKGHMVTLLKQAHDRLVDVDTQRRQLLNRMLAIMDVNIPEASETTDMVRRDRHEWPPVRTVSAIWMSHLGSSVKGR
ncbi:MAG: helix-turn-helix domain-containing protein [Alphaproteobacteria bacterium]|nr:helix-turn-helix domain-containing protein [Alphaproteobacteria bacterium]MCZ6509812.1 helix-turn-helix domain-containing protein [Alphaproteobacteria bacterium]MCZ6838928.1 helix-turn-helix domain-containing protein [Alphaproteobacteria bacterium]